MSNKFFILIFIFCFQFCILKNIRETKDNNSNPYNNNFNNNPYNSYNNTKKIDYNNNSEIVMISVIHILKSIFVFYYFGFPFAYVCFPIGIIAIFIGVKIFNNKLKKKDCDVFYRVQYLNNLDNQRRNINNPNFINNNPNFINNNPNFINNLNFNNYPAANPISNYNISQ